MLRIISLKTCRDTNLLYCAASKGYMNASITRFRHCAQITAAVMQSCKLDYLSWIKARIEERINQLSDLTINLVCALPHTPPPPLWFLLVVWFCWKRQTAAWLAVENKGKTEQNVPFLGWQQSDFHVPTSSASDGARVTGFCKFIITTKHRRTGAQLPLWC